MRTKTPTNIPISHRDRRRFGLRPAAAVPFLMASALALSACGSDKEVGTVGHVTGFAGSVVADEPRAALVGQDVLSAGGSPADAAVAMAFTLSVTLPSQAGLGAGGACLVYDHEKKTVEALNFISAPPSDPRGIRPAAVPIMPRGMFMLQSKYGRLHWEQLLSPAEALARNGTQVSRAFANQLAPFAGALFDDGPSREVFGHIDGTPLVEGERFQQPDLGATISRLRLRGAGEFYTGRGAGELVAAAAAIGASLSTADLEQALPKWETPVRVKYGDDTAYFVPPPADAGMVEAELWKMLAASGRFENAAAAVRPHLLAEAFARVYADRSRWLNPEGTSSQRGDDLIAQGHVDGLWSGYADNAHTPQDGDPPADVSAGTGFAAMDGDGNAVVCSLSLNNGFGTGRLLPNYGFYLPFAPGIKGRGPYSVGPMLAINTNSNEFRFAAAAGGNTAAATALTQTALAALIGGQPLRDAVAAKRLHAVNNPDQVMVEADYPNGAALQSDGHEVGGAAPVARVNALQCASGSPSSDRCQAAADPRGAGLGLVVGKD